MRCDLTERHDDLKDLTFRDILCRLAADDGCAGRAASQTDSACDDARRICDFFSRVIMPAFAGVSGNVFDLTVFQRDSDRTAKRAADAGQFSFFRRYASSTVI